MINLLNFGVKPVVYVVIKNDWSKKWKIKQSKKQKTERQKFYIGYINSLESIEMSTRKYLKTSSKIVE